MTKSDLARRAGTSETRPKEIHSAANVKSVGEPLPWRRRTATSDNETMLKAASIDKDRQGAQGDV